MGIRDKYNGTCYFCPLINLTDTGYELLSGLHIFHRFTYGILFCILISNSITISTILTTRKLLNVNGLLMLILSISDISFGFFVNLPVLIADLTNFLPYKICYVQATLLLFSGGFSVMTLLFLNLDRYLAIARPLFYERFVTKKKAFLLILFNFIFHFGFTTKFLIEGNIKLSSVPFTCIFAPEADAVSWIFGLAVDYGLTFILLCCVYTHVIIIRRRLRKVTDLNVNKGRNKVQRKGFRTLILIVSTYYLCWTPTIIDIGATILFTHYSIVIHYLGIFSLHILALNGFFNSLIYGTTNKAFKCSLRAKFNKFRAFCGFSYRNAICEDSNFPS